jgi:hypothetical protein
MLIGAANDSILHHDAILSKLNRRTFSNYGRTKCNPGARTDGYTTAYDRIRGDIG